MYFSNKLHYVIPLKEKKIDGRPTNTYAKQESVCHLWSYINSKQMLDSGF